MNNVANHWWCSGPGTINLVPRLMLSAHKPWVRGCATIRNDWRLDFSWPLHVGTCRLQNTFAISNIFSISFSLREVDHFCTHPCNTDMSYGYLAATDTSLLRTLCKSTAKFIINYIAVALAITDSRYYGIAHTSCARVSAITRVDCPVDCTFFLAFSHYISKKPRNL